jgi:FkbM family methyltransferase
MFKFLKLFKQNTISVFDDVSKSTFKLVLRDDCYIEKEIQQFGLYGYFEKESLKLWSKLCKDSSVIIDIGANTGLYSILAKVNNPNSQVLSIEPIHTNFSVLKSNIKINKFQINTEQVALSNVKGVAKMYMFKDKLNYMTSINSNRYEGNPEIIQGKEIVEVDVPLEKFSTLFNKYAFSSLDLIKIDVEGHEVEVLSSMIELIKKYKSTILVEILTNDVAESLNLLFKDLGYYFIEIDEVSMPKKVEKLNENHHHNYLVCNQDIYLKLCNNKLIVY